MLALVPWSGARWEQVLAAASADFEAKKYQVVRLADLPRVKRTPR